MKKIIRLLKIWHWEIYISDLVTLYQRGFITYEEYQRAAAKAEEKIKNLN